MQSTENNTNTRMDLDAIQSRVDAATPDTWVYFDDTMNSDGTVQTANVLPVGIFGANPWQVAACSGGPVEPEDGDDTRGRQASLDAEFIAHAREDVPALLAALAAERDRADRAEARIAELQQPRPLHLYADECVGGYFLREASDSEKRTLHRFVQEVLSPRVIPEATA